MMMGYAFLAGLIVGVVGTMWVKRKIRKMVPGSGIAEKAKEKSKSILDRAMDSIFSNKKDQGGKK